MENNCIHQYERGNFCGQCGVALKEKCSECGEMERIDRSICETKLEKARKKYHSFIAENSLKGISEPKYSFRSIFIFSFISIDIIPGIVCVFCVIFTDREELIFSSTFLSIIVGIFVSMFFFHKLVKKESENCALERMNEENAEIDFPKKFPEYAEILRIEEEAQKKRRRADEVL